MGALLPYITFKEETMIEFNVEEIFFETQVKLGYKEEGKPNTKEIEVKVTYDESEQLREIFKRLDTQVNDKTSIVKAISEQDKLVSLTTDADKYKQEIDKLHMIKEQARQLEIAIDGENEELGIDMGNIFFKDQVDFLKNVMPEIEYNNLVGKVGLLVISTLIDQNKEQYTNTIQQ